MIHPGHTKEYWHTRMLRTDRLTAAREGVVKALEAILDFKPTATFEIDWTVGEAGHSDNYMIVLDDARAALRELEEASKP